MQSENNHELAQKLLCSDDNALTVTSLKNDIDALMTIDKKRFLDQTYRETLVLSLRKNAILATDTVRIGVIGFVFKQWKKTLTVTPKKTRRSYLRQWQTESLTEIINQLLGLESGQTNYLYAAFVRNHHTRITSEGITLRRLRKILVDFTVFKFTNSAFSKYPRAESMDSLTEYTVLHRSGMRNIGTFNVLVQLVIDNYSVTRQLFYFKRKQLKSFLQKLHVKQKGGIRALLTSFLWTCLVMRNMWVCRRDNIDCTMIIGLPLMILVNLIRIRDVAPELNIKIGTSLHDIVVFRKVLCSVAGYYNTKKKEPARCICYEIKKKYTMVLSNCLRKLQNIGLGDAKQTFKVFCNARKFLIKSCAYGKCNKSLNLKRRKCKGCAFALYCDRQCQRRDWKAKHKTECEMLSGF